MEIFNLPDVGEGLTEADIAEWRVNVGDTVAVNDVLVEIETAKSLVELPSPYAGTVAQRFAEEGETLNVGEPLIGIATADSPETNGAGSDGAEAPDTGTATAAQVGPDAAEVTQDQVEDQAEEQTEESTDEALVGSGPVADRAGRRRRVGSAAPQPVQPAQPAAPAARPEPTPTPVPASAPTPTPAAPRPANKLVTNVRERTAEVAGLWQRVLAKPPVRRIAKELGVDLTQVTPTGAYGEVTRTDVENYLKERDTYIEQSSGFWMPDTGDNAQRTERIKVKGVRKATAKAMVKSYTEAPHVSIYVDVDATRTMEFVKRLKDNPDFEGVKVTPLLILAKAVIWAAARNPHVNASWTDEEILVKHYMNLGIAAATPRGLLVPNIKNAHEMSLRELAHALSSLTKRARDGKMQPGDMADGTISITNIGALGIDTGTPILNPGEVAIVAFGTIRQKPWVVSGEVIPRWITTLGGSFDHRVVDGDLSARFMADVAAIMEEPALLLD
ncbi:MAG: dihydrolipoamide acetyltransferase family protein [Micrococcaceae bacterium]